MDFPPSLTRALVLTRKKVEVIYIKKGVKKVVFDLRTANITFRSTQCMHRNLSRIQTWAKVYVIIKSRPPLLTHTI